MASQYETAGQNETVSRNDSPGEGQVDKVLSTAIDVARMPIDVARQVLPARGGLPVYAGLGALAVIGLIDWPVAAAAGAGWALARLSSRQAPAPAAPDPISGHAPGMDPVTRPAPGAPGTGEATFPGAGAPAGDPLSPPTPGAPTEEFGRPAPVTKPEGDPLGDSAPPASER